MRKCVLLALVAIAVVVTTVAGLLRPQPRIGPASFHRIQAAMTIQEVEEIIGLPPGDYYTGPLGVGGITSRGPYGFTREERGISDVEVPEAWRIREGEHLNSWWGNRYAIIVLFDGHNHAVRWELLDVVPAVSRPGILERLAKWFRR
jgi:hypothetical protein